MPSVVELGGVVFVAGRCVAGGLLVSVFGGPAGRRMAMGRIGMYGSGVGPEVVQGEPVVMSCGVGGTCCMVCAPKVSKETWWQHRNSSAAGANVEKWCFTNTGWGSPMSVLCNSPMPLICKYAGAAV